MSGSETGLIAGREEYGLGIQDMDLEFNPSVTPTGADVAQSGESVKRKERPMKYVPDGSPRLSAVPNSPVAVLTHSGGAFSSSPIVAAPLNSFKKARGRPLGSKTKHQTENAGSSGLGFTPHVITVKAGEDVSSKIMSFSQNGPRAICILSANGAISNVTLRQPATSGGSVTYEGRFEILSLSGSFMLLESGGQRSRAGGLSVSLAGSDGRVLGGCVAGLLTAASPVQVIVGSFITDGGRPVFKAAEHVEPFSGAPNLRPPGGSMPLEDTGPSHGSLSESSSGSGSPLNHSAQDYNNNDNQPISSSIPWK